MNAARCPVPVGGQEEAEILVVDDDPEVREALCDVLEDEGYAVVRAANGAEAIRYLRKGRPRAIVLDLTMPVMDGYEFLDRRASDPTLSDIPVVVVSATIDARVPHEDVEVIRKPIDLDALLLALHEQRAAQMG